MLTLLNATIYVGLAASALFLWYRRRDSATAWLAGAWGCLGIAVLMTLVISDVPGDKTGADAWVIKIGLVLPMILYPYCLVRFSSTFDRRPVVSRLAGGLTLLVAVLMLALPYFPAVKPSPWWLLAWTGLFFVQWVGLSLFAAFRLWWAARTEPPVTRRRMHLLSAAAVALSAAILLPTLTQSSGPLVQGIGVALSVGVAALVLIGLNPPAWVRSIWRRREHRLVYDLQLALISAESKSEVATSVLPVVTRLLGCGAAVMVDGDGEVVASEGDPRNVAVLMAAAAAPLGPGVDQPGLVRANLRSGFLVAQVGHYAPVLGTDEVQLFESIAMTVDSALTRIESRNELAEAHDRALEASRLKSEFLANMSHEIRTPINGVIGLTELLSLTELNEEQRAYTSTIQSSADALLSVLNDILDFSKIEAGKLDLNARDFELSAAVEDVMALLAGAANAKHVELAMAVGDDLPRALRGDVGRLRQVLLNLAGNAVKFTETGEVVIRVSRVHPGLDVTSRGLWLRFEVTDSGPGIPPESLATLFESFSQADASSTRRHGGTGLGLAISKRLIELMGGTISVETELGRGSTFWFELEMEPASAGWTVSPPTKELRGRSVLVVDDNETNRTILVETAKSWDLEVVAARDVEQALVELERRHQASGHFDLAWIDHQMPGRNGTELARVMAADGRFHRTARILLTSSGDRSGLTSGELHAHLTKPVRPSVLLECVTELLDAVGPVEPAAGVSEDSSGESMAAEPSALETGPTPDQPPVEADEGCQWESAPSELALTESEATELRRRVLVAEDNRVSQQVARRMLESLGCSVDIAGSGTEVLAAAEGRPYALIFMDCQMPIMDGYAATAVLREREGGLQHTPIVALTASAMKGDAERCLKAGMDDYLTKPVRISDFRAALDRWLPEALDAPVDLAELRA